MLFLDVSKIQLVELLKKYFDFANTNKETNSSSSISRQNAFVDFTEKKWNLKAEVKERCKELQDKLVENFNLNRVDVIEERYVVVMVAQLFVPFQKLGLGEVQNFKEKIDAEGKSPEITRGQKPTCDILFLMKSGKGLVIEVKKRKAYENVNNTASMYAQVATYLHNGEYTYGMLTCFDKTRFFALKEVDKKWELLVSDEVNCNDKDVTLFQHLYYILQK